MITSKVKAVHYEAISALPVDAVQRIKHVVSAVPSDTNDELCAWWQGVELDWGVPGRVVQHNGEVIGVVVFAPAPHLPVLRRLKPTLSSDSVGLAVLWNPSESESVARHLIQVVVRETTTRHHDAVEAIGETGPKAAVDRRWLDATGFRLYRPHQRRPLYRIDVHQTVRLKRLLGTAIEGIAESLHPEQRPRGVYEIDATDPKR